MDNRGFNCRISGACGFAERATACRRVCRGPGIRNYRRTCRRMAIRHVRLGRHHGHQPRQHYYRLYRGDNLPVDMARNYRQLPSIPYVSELRAEPVCERLRFRSRSRKVLTSPRKPRPACPCLRTPGTARQSQESAQAQVQRR